MNESIWRERIRSLQSGLNLHYNICNVVIARYLTVLSNRKTAKYIISRQNLSYIIAIHTKSQVRVTVWEPGRLQSMFCPRKVRSLIGLFIFFTPNKYVVESVPTLYNNELGLLIRTIRLLQH